MDTLFKMFTRSELQEIRDRAHYIGTMTEVSPSLRRALLQLSDASDYNDAIMARAISNGKLDRDIPVKKSKKK
jgi:hypothetical protein